MSMHEGRQLRLVEMTGPVHAIRELPRPRRPGGGPRGIWIERLTKAKVKSNPGYWYLIMDCETADSAANHARNVNHQRVLLPEGKWLATSRTVDGRHCVFVSYRGNEIWVDPTGSSKEVRMLTREAKKAEVEAVADGLLGMQRLGMFTGGARFRKSLPTRRDIESAIRWFDKAKAHLETVLDGC